MLKLTQTDKQGMMGKMDGCVKMFKQLLFMPSPMEQENKTQASWCFSLLCDCLCARSHVSAAMHDGIQTVVSAGSMHDCCWEGALSSPFSSHFIFPVSHLLFLSPTSPSPPFPYDKKTLSCSYCWRAFSTQDLNPKHRGHANSNSEVNKTYGVKELMKIQDNFFDLQLIPLLSSYTLYISLYLFHFLYLPICSNA